MLTKEAKQFLLENTPKIPGLSARELPTIPDMSRRLKPMPMTLQDMKRFGRDVLQGAEDASYKFISEKAIPAGKAAWSVLLDIPNQRLLQTNLLLGKNQKDATDVYYKNRKDTAKRIYETYEGRGGVRKQLLGPWKDNIKNKPISDTRLRSGNFFFYQFPLYFSTGLGRIPMPKVIQKPITKVLNKIPSKVVKGAKIGAWLPYQMGENYLEEKFHDTWWETVQNMEKLIDTDATSQ